MTTLTVDPTRYSTRKAARDRRDAAARSARRRRDTVFGLVRTAAAPRYFNYPKGGREEHRHDVINANGGRASADISRLRSKLRLRSKVKVERAEGTDSLFGEKGRICAKWDGRRDLPCSAAAPGPRRRSREITVTLNLENPPGRR